VLSKNRRKRGINTKRTEKENAKRAAAAERTEPTRGELREGVSYPRDYVLTTRDVKRKKGPAFGGGVREKKSTVPKLPTEGRRATLLISGGRGSLGQGEDKVCQPL